jgi:hypothetical protein
MALSAVLGGRNFSSLPLVKESSSPVSSLEIARLLKLHPLFFSPRPMTLSLDFSPQSI